jgi:hypothetical protein
MWLCHDENQKHKITHEQYQNRRGTAQRRKTGLLANPIQAYSGAVHGMAGRRRRLSVNRIEGKIKKCQICQNLCNGGVNPIFQRRPSYHGAQAWRLVTVCLGLKTAWGNFMFLHPVFAVPSSDG